MGDVNVGKSSLLNAFAKYDRAIVTNSPGTTRDVIQTTINIDDLTFNFLDTAGIRKTKNKIETLGIKKAINTINDADLVLHVIDGSKQLSKQYYKINDLLLNTNHINVINKSDVKTVAKVKGIKISALKKQIKPLINAIKNKFKTINLSTHKQMILQSKLSIEILDGCANKLSLASKAIKNNHPHDIILQNLHDSLEDILELTGEKKDFNFINEMFKNFCIGK